MPHKLFYLDSSSKVINGVSVARLFLLQSYHQVPRQRVELADGMRFHEKVEHVARRDLHEEVLQGEAVVYGRKEERNLFNLSSCFTADEPCANL